MYHSICGIIVHNWQTGVPAGAGHMCFFAGVRYSTDDDFCCFLIVYSFYSRNGSYAVKLKFDLPSWEYCRVVVTARVHDTYFANYFWKLCTYSITDGLIFELQSWEIWYLFTPFASCLKLSYHLGIIIKLNCVSSFLVLHYGQIDTLFVNTDKLRFRYT